MLSLRSRVNLGAMVMKEYSTYSLKHQDWSLVIRLFSVISKKLVEGVLSLCKDAVGVFYNRSRLGYSSFSYKFWRASSITKTKDSYLEEDEFIYGHCKGHVTIFVRIVGPLSAEPSMGRDVNFLVQLRKGKNKVGDLSRGWPKGSLFR